MRSLVIAAACCLGGCGLSHTGVSDTATLAPEMKQVLAQIDAKDYGAMWDEGSDALQSGANKMDFVSRLQQLDAKMGQCQAPVLTATMGPSATMSAEYEEQTFTRKCTSGNWTVTISVKGQNGTGQLNTYFADPAPTDSNATSANAAASTS